MKIVKRDGTFEEFNLSKIENAVLKAYKANDRSTLDIPTFLKDDFVNCYTVEQIQDKVVDILRHKDPEIAESYQTYRLEHQKIRNVDKVMEDFSKFINKENSFVLKEAMTKLFGLNIENQNANVDEYSFGGRTGEMTRVITKYIALNYIISDMARSNHVNNEIYIHDLDSYAVGSHNCLTIPFSKLLKEGFVTRNASVRPAKSLKAACQLIAVIFQCQSQCQFGGCAAGTIDWDLIPYLRMSFAKHYVKGRKWFDNIDQTINNPEEYEILDTNIYDLNSKAYGYAKEMINEELAQSMESLYHNLNTLQSRAGDQLPFTSINYGTCTLIEGRMITRALLEAVIKGVGKLYETSIFPCGIFQYKKGINDKPGTPNYDLKILAIKAMTQRIYPNWANCDWSVNANCDPKNPKTWMATMGCRTYNGLDINGLGQLKEGRGNICPVTIILPTLAMEAERNFPKFLQILEQKIDEAKDMLIERYEWICSQDAKSAPFMWENNTMAGYIPEKGIRSALKHGTLAIGQLGLAEALQLLINTDQTTEEGMECAKKIEELFKKKCAEFKKLYKLNFGVYYTPAENLCYTALKKFRDKYGIIPNVSDREFFTNSIHVPVWKEMTPFEKMDIESQLTGYSNAG